MSQDYTDEAGKVIKGSNPFIEEPNQSNTVVDMKGERRIEFKWIIDKFVLHFRRDGSQWHHWTSRRTSQSSERPWRWAFAQLNSMFFYYGFYNDTWQQQKS